MRTASYLLLECDYQYWGWKVIYTKIAPTQCPPSTRPRVLVGEWIGKRTKNKRSTKQKEFWSNICETGRSWSKVFSIQTDTGKDKCRTLCTQQQADSDSISVSWGYSTTIHRSTEPCAQKLNTSKQVLCIEIQPRLHTSHTELCGQRLKTSHWVLGTEV